MEGRKWWTIGCSKAVNMHSERKYKKTKVKLVTYKVNPRPTIMPPVSQKQLPLHKPSK